MPVDQLADTIPGMSVNEWALMDRIATGDPGALEALYHRFHPKLARFLWRLIGRREGLEEIINDTFVDVWKGARNFRGASLVVSARSPQTARAMVCRCSAFSEARNQAAVSR